MRYDARQKMDGRSLLSKAVPGSAALVFFDPQYRDVLDKLKFGNEGARQKKRAKLPQMDAGMIGQFLTGIERALKPSGHVALWVDKFLLITGQWTFWLHERTELRSVDAVAWNAGRFGMGRRFRYAGENLIMLQKLPIRAKGVWTDHRIPDRWTEYADRSVHPHAKPIQLQQRLIRAVTKRGDLVIDPCAGSYGVLECCRETGRRFLGCDLIG